MGRPNPGAPQAPAAEAGVWQEPPRGGFPPDGVFALSGLEQLQAMLAGHVPVPPMGRLTGLRLTEAAPDTATFCLPLTGWLASPQGPVSIGPVTIAADAAMACAIQTALPPATPFSTSELSLRLLAPVHPEGLMTATGRLIQARRTIGLAEVSLTDGAGQLLGHGSTLCFMQAPLSAHNLAAPASADPPSAGEPPTSPSPDPYQRPVVGAVLGEEVWRGRSGLQVLQAQLSGELPPPPIHYLTGLSLQAAEDGRTEFTMPASPWFCAPARARVQGGFVATLAEAALSAAIQTKLPPGTALAPVDLKVNYLRPLSADGRLAQATGTLEHLGRRVAVATARVRDGDGRAVAVATGSALLLPGRSASLGGEPA